MRIAIESARLIDPAAEMDRIGGLYLAEGRIVGVGAMPVGFEADRRIDGRGLIAAPGLIDLCARMREPGTDGALRVEMRAALAGGVTGVVCPPDTDPPLDEPGLVRMLRQRSREAAGARLYPLGALTAGLKGEALAQLCTLAEVGCVAFAQTGALPDQRGTLLSALRYARTFDFAVWLRPVDSTLASEGVVGEGAVAGRLGLAAVPVVAETVALHTIFELQRATGRPPVRIHLCRLSTAAGIELLRAARREGLPVTADVSILQVHGVDADIGQFDSNWRLDPPLHSEQDRAAIRAALADGTIDAICSDHAPAALEDKLLPFGEARVGASGLETLLSLMLGWAQAENIPLLRALDRLTRGPARVLGEDTGTLLVGRKADVVLFDPSERWTVDDGALLSSGKNTPYLGSDLAGRVRATIVGGEIRFERAAEASS
ncbi:MAG TPA: dihydroorotase [Burkholderiaceae bacterium]|jgi:dihydroorotase|nr:dihydroorotase [Burkholderiaceae bacterium]